MAELFATTQQENQPELAQNQNHEFKLAKTVQAMERLHATEIFGTPEQSKAFLDSLDYDEFKKYISFVNGVELDTPVAERGKVNDSYVQLSCGPIAVVIDYLPPHKSLRDPLLKMAFEKAQSIDDPEIAGLTLGLSINAIHYFADGNGRTARMTYALLSRGYDGSPEDQEYYSSLLENIKGREVINPNPAISGIDRKIRSEMLTSIMEKRGYNAEVFGGKMPTHIYDGYPNVCYGEYTPEKLAVSDDIDEYGRYVLYRTMESGGMTMISLMAAFEPERVKDFVKTAPSGNRTSIHGNDFLPTLSKEEIVHWWHESEYAIAAYVQKLINVSDREDIAEIAAHYRCESK